MKNILLIPGWMKSLKLYKISNSNFEICVGELDEKSFSADCIVGFSLSSLTILEKVSNIKGRIILINPPVPKRNILIWFIRWIDYLVISGLFLKRQKFIKNPIKLMKEFINCIRLLNIDFSETLDKISRERLTVIRGKSDRFFCDTKAVEFLHSKNITVREIDGSHNWSEGSEEMLNKLIA